MEQKRRNLKKKTKIKTYVDGNGFFGGDRRDVKDLKK